MISINIKIIASCIVIIILAIWTYQRNTVWSDSVLLWRDCATKNPQSARAMNNLGAALLADGYNEEAMRVLDEIDKEMCEMSKKPDEIDLLCADIFYNLGCAYLINNRFEQAIVNFEQSVVSNPGFHQAYNNMGIAYKGIGDAETAEECFKKALEIKPDFEDARENIKKLKLLDSDL